MADAKALLLEAFHHKKAHQNEIFPDDMHPEPAKASALMTINSTTKTVLLASTPALDDAPEGMLWHVDALLIDASE